MKVRGFSGADLVVDLRCKWPKMGPDFTPVNYHSGNYVRRFGGDLPVIWQPIWGRFGGHFQRRFIVEEMLSSRERAFGL